MYLFVYLITACILRFSAGDPDIPVCDQNIVGRIQQYWNENGGPPQGILNYYFQNGVEFAFASTSTYFRMDTNCVSYVDYSPTNGVYRTAINFFHANGEKATFDTDNYETNGIVKEDDNNVKNVNERSGIVYLKWRKLLTGSYGLERYHIFLENGVYCIYSCTSNALTGKSNMSPEALVKMSKASPDNGAAQKCITLLSSWGIQITRFYSDSCAQTSTQAEAQVPVFPGQQFGDVLTDDFMFM